MALLEAASCGLFVVSTCVGGVPEVLPPSMIKFADSTTVDDLFSAISEAVVVSRRMVPNETHARIKSMYSWSNVCDRTEIIYYSMMQNSRPSIGTRLLR
jgi:phosphatidylinositol glycan class A protein